MKARAVSSFDRRRNQCERSHFDTFTTDSVDNKVEEIFEKTDALLLNTFVLFHRRASLFLIINLLLIFWLTDKKVAEEENSKII